MPQPDPLVIVRPEILTLSPEVTKTGFAPSPITERTFAPGPEIFTDLSTLRAPLVKAIVPVTLEPNVIVSPSGGDASPRAWRNEPAPLSLLLTTRNEIGLSSKAPMSLPFPPVA